MIYLHHYPMSPFSEKVRLLLGHYQLTWHSVEISVIMPRPLLMPLSGGYRRTPVLQIGANIYCDTKIICKALARHVGDAELYARGFAASHTAEWADTQLFRAIVALNFRPEARALMMKAFSEKQLADFIKDRAQLTGDQPLNTVSSEAAMGYFRYALAELENTLEHSQFVLGGQLSIADFSVYHNLWFLRNNPINADLLKPYPAVSGWLLRMHAIGHGNMLSSDGEVALKAALEAKPASPKLDPLDGNEFAVGGQVSVAPADYGCVPVVGRLLGMNADEIIIERTTEQTGAIYNHFPYSGFTISSI